MDVLPWIYLFYTCRETLIGYTSLFSPYDFEKIDNIILRYFKNKF